MAGVYAVTKMAGRTDAEECLHSKTGQCLYQEYVYTGFYAEPDLCEG